MERGAWQSSTFDSHLTRAVRTLLVSTVALFVVQILMDYATGRGFTRIFGLSYVGMRRAYLWQPVTYMFVHGGFFHVLMNMLYLFFLGPETERAIGTRHFYWLYFFSGILGGVGWLLVNDNPIAICIGASGAVFGVLGAFAALFPHRQITLLLFFILPITMKAWVLAASLGALQLLFLLGPFSGNIAYAAHIAGGIAGLIYARVLFGQSGPRPSVSHSERMSRFFRPFENVRNRSRVSHEELDRILDKIASHGMKSLTRRERSLLDEASKERRSREGDG